MSDVTLDDLLTKKLLRRQYIVEADIHPFVKGTDFETVWRRKVESEFGSTKVYFATLEDFIEMKQTASRAKDLEDLKYLTMLRERMRRE